MRMHDLFSPALVARGLLLAACVLSLPSWLLAFSPQHVVFTWQGDTGTTLTVNYQTLGDRRVTPQVFYDTQPRGGRLEEYRHRAEGRSFQIPGIEDRWLHRVELTGLTPGSTIYLTAGDPAIGTSREIKVRTIPHDDRPLRFIAGGDLDAKHETREMLRLAATFSPDFALIGGDIAYDDGRLSNLGMWDSLLSYWADEMITPDGFSIPLVAAIGNHEVRGGYGGSGEDVPFYFSMLGQQPEARSYFAHQFGANLVVLSLDTGHVAAHEGAQTQWLEETLERFKDVPFRAAQYHVPLYPSTRSFDDRWATLGRKHWLPLFDRYELTVAFENHEHTFKRSHLLRNNEVVTEGGTLYLGDGAWGREQRPVTKGGRWYLEKAAQMLHFWVVDVDRNGLVYRAIDRHGRTFDVYPGDAPGAAEAKALYSTLRSNYILPSGVASGRMVDETRETADFATVLQLNNTFDAPMTVSMAYHSGPLYAQAEGLPVKLRVEPGERKEHAFTLHLAQPQHPKDTRYWVSTVVEVEQPGGLPDVYQTTLTVQSSARGR
jgi:Predicted phosphohydrolases